MRKTKLIIVLLAFSFTLTFNLTAKAVTDEWVTRTLDEDLFLATYLFDGVDMVYFQGDYMQIRSWLWFEGPVLQWGRYVKEAYLSVKIASVGGTDPDATMTIWGKPSGKGGNPSYYEDPSAINGPYTANSYTVNLSSFVDAGGWHNITVTRILREINQGYYHYDGHDIAFVTLSTSDHDAERTITSEESGNAAKLYIHYGQPDPGDDEYPNWLPEGGEFVEDYRNHTIWKYDAMLNATMSYYWDNETGAAEGYYHSTYERGLADNTDRDLIAEPGDYNSGLSNTDTICRIGDSIFTMNDFGEPQLWYSTDAGETWSGLIINDQYTDLAPHISQTLGSMSVDENGTVHMIWGTFTPASPAAARQVYSNFTISANGTINFFDGYTEFGNPYIFENIEADNYGRIHILFVRNDGDLYYKIRFINGTWANNELIESQDSLLFPNVDVANMPGDYPLARFVYSRQWVGVEDIYQTIRDPDGTLHETVLKGTNTFYPSSANDVIGNCSWAAWTDIPGGSNPQVDMRGYNFTTDTLLAEIAVSATNEEHRNPDIGIGEDGNGYIVWYSSWHLDFWGRRFDLTDGSFIENRQRIIDFNIATPNAFLQITPWNVEGYVNTTYYIADMNGTLIDEFTIVDDTNGTQEAEDFVDETVYGYPDPEDPNPPGWDEESWLTASRFKLIIFIVGMVLLLGSPTYGFAERPEASTWIILMMNMIVGVALLWSLQTM